MAPRATRRAGGQVAGPAAAAQAPANDIDRADEDGDVTYIVGRGDGSDTRDTDGLRADHKSRIQWAKEQMEKAYRVEAGLEPAAKSKPRAPSAARKEKTKHDMLTAGEAVAAENDALMTDIMSQVEQERLERMRRNRAVMAEMGLLEAAADLRGAVEAEKKERSAARKQRATDAAAEVADPERRSSRAKKAVERLGEFATGNEPLVGEKQPGSSSKCAVFGEVEGIKPGHLWLSRVRASQDGVHGPWVGGIHGPPSVGAYSVVLSGGYEDDLDRGADFTYTGSGGRDLSGNKRTAPQSRDQELQGSNLALAVSMWRKLPIRVVRGYKCDARYAPKEGYRYDGLYQVVDMWPEIGKSGFVIWRYHFRRSEGQGPAPWEEAAWRVKEAKKIEELKAENGDAPLIPKGTGTMALAMRRRAKEAKVGAKRGGKRARVVEEEQGEGAGVAVGTRSGAGRSRRQRVVA